MNFRAGLSVAMIAAAMQFSFAAQVSAQARVPASEKSAEVSGDLAFGRFIALIRGHLLAGDELVKRRDWSEAYPHFNFPTEEIYGVIRDELHAYKTPPFDGDLKALAIAAVEDDAAWEPRPSKMRSPVEYVTAGYRLLDLPGSDADGQLTRAAMMSARAVGEFPMTASSPKGWPLTSDAWSGPDAVLNRIEWAKQVSGRMPEGLNAAKVAVEGMGPLVAPATKTAMARAETQGDALALLMSSPEFQRR